MAVTLNFKDGNTAVITGSVNVVPWKEGNTEGNTIDENFVSVINAESQIIAFVPVVNLNYATVA